MLATELSGKNTLLSYAVSSDPDPIQVSPSSGTTSQAALTIVASNNSPDAIYCKKIIFSISVGTDAQELTNDLSSVTHLVSPADIWQISADGAGDFTVTPKSGSPVEVTTKSVIVQLLGIEVNQECGVTTFTIEEKTSKKNDSGFSEKTAAYNLDKFPYGYFLKNFASDAPSVNNGGTVTLTWQASDEMTLKLLYGSASVNVTGKDTWTSPALNNDTTFILEGTTNISNRTVNTYRSTTVVVQKPEIAATSIHVEGNVDTHTQGAYLEWNKDGSSGETYLLNQKGLGSGGFIIGEIDTANTITESVRIDASGNVGIAVEKVPANARLNLPYPSGTGSNGVVIGDASNCNTNYGGLAISMPENPGTYPFTVIDSSGNQKFDVDVNGSVTAQDATINGNLTADSGTVQMISTPTSLTAGSAYTPTTDGFVLGTVNGVIPTTTKSVTWISASTPSYTAQAVGGNVSWITQNMQSGVSFTNLQSFIMPVQKGVSFTVTAQTASGCTAAPFSFTWIPFGSGSVSASVNKLSDEEAAKINFKTPEFDLGEVKAG